MEYKEILRLKEMLEKAGIPFEFTDNHFGYFGEKYKRGIFYPAYSIIISKNGKRLCDAIEHYGSYGQERDLLEIMGGLTAEEQKRDDVLGYLTAEEVFKRFKYCYEHGTSTYNG